MALSGDHDRVRPARDRPVPRDVRSEEHTSELQSRSDLVCRLLLEKKKNNEPTIFARNASRSSSSRPLIPATRQPPANLITHEPWELKNVEVRRESNAQATAQNDVAIPKGQPVGLGSGSLGPWEVSISNVIPYEEVTRVVSDFLFNQVVMRDDVDDGSAGTGHGAHLEIEAKIGHLIDRNTDIRLRLPVMTETVLSQNDPSMRIAFKSSMTEVSL